MSTNISDIIVDTTLTAGPSFSRTAAASQTPDQANAAGVSTSFSNADHVHNIATSAPANQTIAASPVVGVEAAFARSDHGHTFSTASGISVGPSNGVGVSTSFSRADHAHQGVHSLSANGGTERYGDQSLNNGLGTTVTDSGTGSFTIDTNFGPNEFAVTSTSGLQINYTGGRFNNGQNGSVFNVPSGSVTVTANTALGYLYVAANPGASPLVLFATTTPPVDALPFATYVSGPTTVATTDVRSFVQKITIGESLRPYRTGTLAVNYNGGRVNINGTITNINGGTITVTANTSGVIYVDPSTATVTSAAVGTFPANCVPMATYTAGPSLVSALADRRAFISNNMVFAAPATQTPDQSNTTGSSQAFAAADHIHNIPTAAAVTLDATTVNSQGAAATFSRADHLHTITTGAASTQTPDQANATGTSANIARADHVHLIPTAAATGLNANSANTQGAAATFNRADHTHAVASGAASAQTPDQVNATGTSTNFARADHVHNIATAAAITLDATSTNTQGGAATFSRSDHTHAITTGAPSTQNATNTNTTGTSTSLARADHLHTITTGVASTQTPDQVNATGSSASLARADHVHTIATAAASGLNANSTNTQGASTSFSRADHTHAIASGVVSTQTPDQANAAGTATNFTRADHVHNIPTGVVSSIGVANTQGAAAAFTRQDHVHQGIHSLTVNGGAQRYGDQNLKNGNGTTLTDDGVGNITVETNFGPNEFVVTSTSGLTVNYTGGRFSYGLNSDIYNIPNGSVVVPANTIGYISAVINLSTGVPTVTVSTTPPALDNLPIASFVSGPSTVATTDLRRFVGKITTSEQLRVFYPGTGFVINYTAGRVNINGSIVAISDGTITVPANVVSGAIYVDGTSLVVTSNSTGTFPAGCVPLYTFTSGPTAVTAIAGARAWLNNHQTFASASTVSSNTNTQGASLSYVRADHTHQLTAGTALLDHTAQFDGSNWQAVYPESNLSPLRAWRKSDEFLSYISTTQFGELGWLSTLNGGGSTIAAPGTLVTNNHPGVLRISGGGAGGRYAAMSLGNAVNGNILLGGGPLTYEWLIYIEALSTATVEYSIRLGLGDTIATDFTSGVYFEYTRTTSTNWLIKTASLGVRTSTTTATAVVAGSWIRLTAQVNAAATLATYLINGVSVGTIATNIPTTGQQVGATTHIAMINANAAANYNIDYFEMSQRFTTSR